MPCVCGDVYCNCTQYCVCLRIPCQCDLCDKMRIAQISPSILDDEIDLLSLSSISLHQNTPDIKNLTPNRPSSLKRKSSTVSTAENTSSLGSSDVQCLDSESQGNMHLGRNTTLSAAPIANLTSKSVPHDDENLTKSSSKAAESLPVPSLSSEKSSYFNLMHSSHNKTKSLTTDVGESHRSLYSSYQAQDITLMGRPKANFVRFLHPSRTESSTSSTNYESDILRTSDTEPVNVIILNPPLTYSATPINYESGTSNLTSREAFRPDTLQSPFKRLPSNPHKSLLEQENKNLVTQSPENKNLVVQSPNCTLQNRISVPSDDDKFPLLNKLVISSTSATKSYSKLNNPSITSITLQESMNTASDASDSIHHGLLPSKPSSRFEPQSLTQVPVVESTTDINYPKKSSVRKPVKSPRSSVSCRRKSNLNLSVVQNQNIVPTKSPTKASNLNIGPDTLTNVIKESSLLRDSRYEVQRFPLDLSKSHSSESVELSDNFKRNTTNNSNTVLSSVRISQSQPNLLCNTFMSPSIVSEGIYPTKTKIIHPASSIVNQAGKNDLESNETKDKSPISAKSESSGLHGFSLFDSFKSKQSDSSEYKPSDSAVCKSPNKIESKQYNTNDGKPSDETDGKLSTPSNIGPVGTIRNEQSLSVENMSSKIVEIVASDFNETIKNIPSDYDKATQNTSSESEETIKHSPSDFDETIKITPSASDETIKNSQSDSDETIENMSRDSVKIADNELSDSNENVSSNIIVTIVQNVQSDSNKTTKNVPSDSVKNVQSNSIESGASDADEDVESDSLETLEKVQSGEEEMPVKSKLRKRTRQTSLSKDRKKPSTNIGYSPYGIKRSSDHHMKLRSRPKKLRKTKM